MLDDIYEEVQSEVYQAGKKYGDFRSTHEGYGVLAEEVAELLDAIRSNKRYAVEFEAIQVAAVAIRIANSLIDKDVRVRSGMS